MAPPEIAMNQPVRVVAPDGAVPPAAGTPAAGPAAAPEPTPLSAKDALLAAIWDYKDRYGLAILCLAGALAFLYYNYWKPSRPQHTPAAAAEWEEKRRLAVERQQAKLREGTAAFLQKQMEENERQKEKRKQRSEADAKRLGMEHLAKKGQKLGHGGPAQQPTSPTPSAAAAEDWLS